ncbi:MAG: XRE family transcriptional regulator [Sphingobacteriia bacterium]|nr:XRE family transcriptional regulator [Sphingobacteriia bacterium]
MSTLGLKLRELREQAGLSLRKTAMQVDIDVAILSKMERGERKFSKELVLKLADLYHVNADKLIIDFLSEKVLYELEDEDFGLEALKVAEKQLKYKKNLNNE